MTKKVAIVLCLVALVGVFAVKGAVSYLQDGQSVTNVFTLGDIRVGLTEPNWPEEGEEPVFYPGDEYDKDPTITALEGDIYFRVKVELVESETTDPVSAAAAALIWDTIYYDGSAVPGVNSAFRLTTTSENPHLRYYTYIDNEENPAVLAESGEVVLFDTVVIPATWGNDEFQTIGDYDMKITVEAIQAVNIEPEDAAQALIDAFGPIE